MENEFIPYEQALALKELGFDEECLGFYEVRLGAPLTITFTPTSYLEDYIAIADYECYVPLWQQAFKWFLEKHKLWFRPDYYDETRTDYTGSIHELGRYSALTNLDEYDSVELLELEALKKLIDLNYGR